MEARVGPAQRIVLGCSFEWLRAAPPDSVHAVVTDPPYAVKEFDAQDLEKRAAGRGGTWRVPPRIGGSERAPLPRFTLNEKERRRVHDFFSGFGRLVSRALVPGGHVFLASNATLSQLVFGAVASSGLEFRGEVVRLVRTLRGGNRPKNAHERYPGVCTTPRGGYEPWGIFRKPLSEPTVEANLDRWKAGGLRREEDGRPFVDVVPCGRTPRRERAISPHPSLKPQAFMRRVVRAALPLGEGVVVDPFLGGGSTVAAALSLGYAALGIERDRGFFEVARKAIPSLAELQLEPEQAAT